MNNLEHFALEMLAI